MALSRFASHTFKRQFSSSALHGEAATAEAGKTAAMWQKMFFFVAVPAIVLSHIHVYLREKNHPPERPEFVPYSCVRIRTKPFPWGDGNHTLFHNPHTNALPTGYEEDVEH